MNRALDLSTKPAEDHVVQGGLTIIHELHAAVDSPARQQVGR
jgi:hypothetical protein